VNGGHPPDVQPAAGAAKRVGIRNLIAYLRIGIQGSSSTARLIPVAHMIKAISAGADLRSSAGWPGSAAPIETEAGTAQPITFSGFTRTRASVQRDNAGGVLSRTIDPSFQSGPRPFPFQHGDRLPKVKYFEGGITRPQKKAPQGRDDDVERESALLHAII
jgi:hypothetical protein